MILATLLLISASLAPGERYYWLPQDFGVQPQFIQKCRFFRSESELQTGRNLPVGLTPLQFDFAINEVYKRMLRTDMDHVPGRSIADTAKLIVDNTVGRMHELGIDRDRPDLLKKWLVAEAVCAWVSTHVELDAEWEKNANAPGSTYAQRFHRLLPSTTLGMSHPAAICAGFSRLTRDLLRAAGLDATHLGGENRDCGATAVGHETHGWVFIDFGDGVQSVADTTAGRVDLNVARKIGGKMHCGDVILPKSPAEWELFLARFYATQVIGDVNSEGTGVTETQSREYTMTQLSYEAWMRRDTSSLGPVWGKYRDAEVDKVKYLNSFTSLPRD